MLAEAAREEGDVTRLSLLRGFELVHDGCPVQLPLSAQRLVAFLALNRRRMARVYVAGVLWLEYSQEAANASLRTTLWRLRRPLAPLVVATTSHLSLSSGVRVDLHEVSSSAKRVLIDRVGCVGDDVDALLGAGDLLPDWYDDWIVMERERFRQQRLHALEAICDELAGEGRYALAVEAGLAAVAAEPLRESTHRAVMRVHLAEGNPNEALRQYRMCRGFLRRQLGLQPSAETELLRAQCECRDGVVTPTA